MSNKYQYSYIKDNFENLSHKELIRFHIFQKLKSFYVKKAIKDGKLFYKKDVKEDLSKFIDLGMGIFKNNLISETQLEALTMKDEAEIRKKLNKQFLASLLEIAYFDYDRNFKTSMKASRFVFEKELNIEIENLINTKS